MCIFMGKCLFASTAQFDVHHTSDGHLNSGFNQTLNLLYVSLSCTRAKALLLSGVIFDVDGGETCPYHF